MASVRQTAGLTSLPERSSNGNGTRTTLYRIVEWLTVRGGVNVLGRVSEKGKSITGHGSSQPHILGIRVSYCRKKCHHETGIRRQVVRLVENDVLAVVMGLKSYRRHIVRITIALARGKQAGVANQPVENLPPARAEAVTAARAVERAEK